MQEIRETREDKVYVVKPRNGKTSMEVDLLFLKETLQYYNA